MSTSYSTRRDAVEVFIPRAKADQSVKAVEKFLRTRVLTLDHSDGIEYGDGALWDDAVSRRVGRKTHGWFFLRFWSAAWEDLPPSTRTRLITTLREMLLTWLGLRREAEMAYHDEGTAQRVMHFIIFLDTARENLNEELITQIESLIREETELLATEDFYAGSNNHGMFQDTALLVAIAYGHCPEIAEHLQELSLGRLVAYFVDCFGRDGIHQENTPTYHLMVARYLSYVIRYCDFHDVATGIDTLRNLFKHADEYGAFALAPNNHFVPISDTKKGPVGVASVEETFGAGKMSAVLSRGRRGVLPESRTFVSEESGYGIYRSDWTGSANYVFFSSAYNADYHKHSDEGSLYYYANGRELLVEAGPNGYEYADPLTKYGFSSAAHNSLLVDGEGLPRTDKKSRQTTLTDTGSTGDSLQVTGRTTRYQGVEWARSVSVDGETQGTHVLVEDQVTSDQEHVFTFLWHIGQGLNTVVRGNAIEIFDADTDAKVGEMTFGGSAAVGIRKTHGQKHPYHQGWIFPEMGVAEPVDVIEVEFRGRDVRVAWDIRSQDFALRDRGVTPLSQWSTHYAEKPVNYLLEGVGDDGEADRLAVVFAAMAEINDFTYNYRASLEGFPGACLYILDDFGDQGSYYLASDRNLAEFRSVQSLIRTVTGDLRVEGKDVLMLGSSKGATAALLHGTTLGVGKVYAGAPQYRIGNFVRNPHPNILEYVAGGTDEAATRWLNDIAFRILSSGSRRTDVTVLVGERDSHHRHHTVPLIDELRMLGYSPENLVVPGTVHSEFGNVYRGFLTSLIRSLKKDDEVAFPNVMAHDPATGQLGLAVSGTGTSVVQAQLFCGSQKVDALQRLTKGMTTWTISVPGDYRARIYYDDPATGERKAFGSTAAVVRKK